MLSAQPRRSLPKPRCACGNFYIGVPCFNYRSKKWQFGAAQLLFWLALGEQIILHSRFETRISTQRSY